MTSSKVTIAAAILAASLASPALAQSFDHTGSSMPYHYDNTGRQVWGSWGPQDIGTSGGYVTPRRHPRQ